MAAMMVSIGSSFDFKLGANPPSSPTLLKSLEDSPSPEAGFFDELTAGGLSRGFTGLDRSLGEFPASPGVEHSRGVDQQAPGTAFSRLDQERDDASRTLADRVHLHCSDNQSQADGDSKWS
jgi:hypothetical protein